MVCDTGVTTIWTGSVDEAQLVALIAKRDCQIELNVPQFQGLAPAAVGQAPKPDSPLSLGECVIAVIDHGCPFAHRQFLVKKNGGWSSRVRYLWDQDASKASGSTTFWRLPTTLYGRELTTITMDPLLKQASNATGQINEDQVYESADYAVMQSHKTHGAHVLDLAAGRIDPITGSTDDAASKADIIFVQLPRLTVADTSGGSMTMYVLDALHYIFEKAAAVKHLVINLSYGSTAGPHDGSSMLERAIDVMVKKERQKLGGRTVQIVLPAGNHFLAEGHARLNLTPGIPEQRMAWQLMPDDKTDSFIELWYASGQAGKVFISIQQPDGTVSSRLGIDQQGTLMNNEGRQVGGVVHSSKTPNGSDSMILIALCPTHPDSWAGRHADNPRQQGWAPADHGVWTVTVHGNGSSPIAVNAWVERDDALAGQRGQRQSHLLSNRLDRTPDDDDLDTDMVRRRSTGNSIANGLEPVVVGAMVGSTGRFSDYSAAGPTLNATRPQENWPNWLAPGDESETLGGLLAAGTRSGRLVRMNGTSVAAPQVTRHLINSACSSAPQQSPKPGGRPANTLAQQRGELASRLPGKPG